MRIIRDMSDLDPTLRGAVAAIGNFDGVHLGHQAVIDQARQIATRTNAPLAVMTFEPHPRSFFAPDAAAFRLMNPTARAARLDKIGIDLLFEVPFDQALAALSPADFATQVIVRDLGLSHVIVGADFRFGKGRAGDVAALQDCGAQAGFDVTVADLLDLHDLAISSTAIRAALTDGRPADACAMLGHLHCIEGIVIKGEQRGRELGYPTANMSIAGLHPPRFGVYAVKVTVRDGDHAGTYQGAASIGVRPMFGENLPNCETFIFDFSGDLYGAEISVALVAFLRPELNFTSLDNLITQMDADCVQAKEILCND